jgi:hypothetical protein
LNSVNIEAYPILLQKETLEKLIQRILILKSLIKTVAFAIADGKQYILDATQENCPAGLTPFQLLGTKAFLVDKRCLTL